MLDLRRPSLPTEQGEPLARADYLHNFRSRERAIHNGDSFKLERIQHFEEVNHPSRDALRRGDWAESLRLMDARRDTLRAESVDDERRGARFHRVRVVADPLTPYVQWELHSLRQQAVYGQRVRVLPVEAVAAEEAEGQLPELVLLDDRTLYRVLYSDAGVPDGAVRWTDPAIIDPWGSYLRAAYAAGEDVLSYFDRAVAHLPPPPAA